MLKPQLCPAALQLAGFFRCLATVNYIGPFGGETLNITAYTAADGDYVPNSPVSIKLSTTSVNLATAAGSTPYPLGRFNSLGECRPTISVNSIYDGCNNLMIDGGNGYDINSCGFTAAVNSTSQLTYCNINNWKGAIGIKYQSNGTLYFSGAGSTIGSYVLSSAYTIDGADGISTFTGTYGTVTTSTASPLAISISAFPTVASVAYPYWYIANNGSIFVPVQSVLSNPYWYWFDRDWMAWVRGQVVGTGSFTNNMWNLTTLDYTRDELYCWEMRYYCGTDGKAVVVSSKVLTDNLWLPISSGFSASSTALTATKSLGALTSTISFTALFSRQPPAVTLASYTASFENGYVAIQGVNGGNAGQISFAVNYTSGPSANPTFSIPKGPFSVRIESKSVSSVCSGASCLLVAYPLANVAPITPVVNYSALATDNNSEFIFRAVVISVVGLVVFILAIFLVVRIRRRWVERKSGMHNYVSMEQMNTNTAKQGKGGSPGKRKQAGHTV